MAVRCCRKFKEHASVRSLTTEMFSFSSSFFLLFLVFFVRGVRFGEASLPATPSIFFFFVLVPTFVPGEVTTLVLVVIVSSRLSLCVNRQKQIFIVLSVGLPMKFLLAHNRTRIVIRIKIYVCIHIRVERSC